MIFFRKDGVRLNQIAESLGLKAFQSKKEVIYNDKNVMKVIKIKHK